MDVEGEAVSRIWGNGCAVALWLVWVDRYVFRFIVKSLIY